MTSIQKATSFAALATLLLLPTIFAAQPAAYAVPAEGSVLATLSGCCGAGVGVGFDGTNLYWMDFSGLTLHKIMTNGTFVADIPITGGNATVISWDSTRNIFWGASGTDIYKITNTGAATLAFSVAGNLPGDCNNGFGCLSLVDGINYDASDDSLWYSPDASQRVYHFKTDGTLLGYIDVNVPPNDMAPVCGFNYNSGVATGSTILYLGANGCNTIFKYNKTGTLLSSFSIGTGRTEDMECDSVTFASQGVDAIWTKDAYDTELIAFAVPQGTCTFGGGAAPSVGKITGGGGQIDKATNFGFNVQSNGTLLKGQLEYQDRNATINLHSISMVSLSINPDMTKGDFTGMGTVSGNPVTFKVHVEDNGEPGKNDKFSITIPELSYTKSGTLIKGNIQIHK